MVELKKKVKRKRKARAVPSQVISQKVTVNIGKSGYGTKRRTGTQAKRSVQPQVIYQQQGIPLQPNYSTELNDLRNEVKTHLSGVNKEEGRRRANDLRELHELARGIAFQEGTQGTRIQTEKAMTMETMSQTDKPERGRSTTEKEIKLIKKRGRPKGASNKPKEAPGVEVAPQSAVLAGVEAEPVPELITLEKEMRSRSLPETPQKLTMDDFTFR